LLHGGVGVSNPDRIRKSFGIRARGELSVLR
jgi:hypothetical protein